MIGLLLVIQDPGLDPGLGEKITPIDAHTAD